MHPTKRRLPMMLLSMALGASLGAVFLTGCAAGGDGAGGSGATASSAAPAASADNRPVNLPADAPSIPANAAYTIYCRDFTGANHAAVAEQVKQQAARASGLDDFYLVRGEQRTVLYHGFYRTYDEAEDPKEAARAQRDRQLIERLQDNLGNRIFSRSVFEPLQRANPDAPAEWDLKNAGGYWSVLIASYTDPVQRKELAVESVREARKMGIEAYYMHTDAQSHVFIGTWPRDAIKQHTSTDRQDQDLQVDPNNPRPIIVSMTKLDERYRHMRDERGRAPILLEVRLDIQDPSLEKTMREYPYSVNGYTDAKPKPPLLVEIPRVTNRVDALESAPTGPAKTAEFDRLLDRPF